MDLDNVLAEVRAYTDAYLSGDRACFTQFTKLVCRLLSITVCGPNTAGQIQPVTRGKTANFVLRGADTLELNNGRYLRYTFTMERDDHKSRPRVLRYSYQYQLDPHAGTDRWVFRYDYERVPDNEHPPGHVHVNATPACPEAFRDKELLDRVHFHTGRISLEAVLRVLIEQFGVPPSTDPAFWRPILKASEAEFYKVMYNPPSGPAV